MWNYPRRVLYHQCRLHRLHSQHRLHNAGVFDAAAYQDERSSKKSCTNKSKVPLKFFPSSRSPLFSSNSEGNQQDEESQYDLSSVMDQMATRVTVRYGDTIMQEGDAFVSGKHRGQAHDFARTENSILFTFRQLQRTITRDRFSCLRVW